MQQLRGCGGGRYLAALEFPAELLPIAGQAVDVDNRMIKTRLVGGRRLHMDSGRREGRSSRRRHLNVVSKGLGDHIGDGAAVGRAAEATSLK